MKGGADWLLGAYLKITRLCGCTDWIDLDFGERQRAPRAYDEAQCSTSVSEALTVEYRLYSRGIRCQAISQGNPRLDTKSRSTAQRGSNPESSCDWGNRDSNHWIAILAVRCSWSWDEQSTAYGVFHHSNNRINRDFSPITSPETWGWNCVSLIDDAHYLQTALAKAGFRFKTEYHVNLNAIEQIFRNSNAQLRPSQHVSAT